MSKKTSIILAVVILGIGVVFFQLLGSFEGAKPQPPQKNQAKPLQTVTIKNQDLQIPIRVTGRLSAVNKIEVYTEVNGVLQPASFRFKAGNQFKNGETLIQIDDKVYRNSLLAQKSALLNQVTLMLPDFRLDFPHAVEKWENFLRDFDLEKPLKPLPATNDEQEKYYIAARNIYNLYYTVKSMEETHAKYKIQAPFSGVVTESNINPGTLVRSGQKLGEFMNTQVFELEVAVRLINVKYLKTGLPVALESEDTGEKFQGAISRINQSISRDSQMLKVYISVKDKRLKDGMYLTAILTSEPILNVARVPRTAVTDNQEVFVLKEKQPIKTPIQIIENYGDKAYVSGLVDGTIVLTEQPEDNGKFQPTESITMN